MFHRSLASTFPMAKRFFDIVASVSGLLFLIPLIGIIALAVKLDSPGSVFYRARRVGKEGKEFYVFKFRTMIVNADKQGAGITVSGDDRITRVGRFLRQMKIDELPQLFNVVRGEMSLVGPRPEDPRYVALYTPEQREVLSVHPGITSPASLEYRNEEQMLSGDDWQEVYINEVMPTKLAIDIEYVQKQNLWLDITLIFRTLLAMFR